MRECVVWRTIDVAIDWFRLQEGDYQRVCPDADLMIESSRCPGPHLNVPAMLAKDRTIVIAALSRSTGGWADPCGSEAAMLERHG